MTGQRTTRLKLFLGAVILIATAFVICGASMLSARQKAPHTFEEAWLSLNADAKAEFVHGYLEGFERGKREACYFYEDEMPTASPVPVEHLPRRVCLDHLPEFKKASSYLVYVETITNYYKKYPHNRQAGPSRIMLEMATPPGLRSIDEIHAKVE
jgi:hypothetical protein